MCKWELSLGSFHPFTTLQDKLFLTASFEWGSTSSAWQLSRHWKADSLQHADVYWKLAESLGEASPLAKLIKKQLKEGALQQPQPASATSASAALSSFWKKQAQHMADSLQTTLGNVEALLGEHEAAGSLEEAWPAEQLSQGAWEEPAGRFDGSEAFLGFWLWKHALGSQASACGRLGQLPPTVSFERSFALSPCSFAAWSRSSLDDSFAGSKATF